MPATTEAATHTTTLRPARDRTPALPAPIMHRTVTPRQREILQLVADLGNRERHADIAHLLNVSVQTVQNHLYIARKRLGARNTTHAVVLAWHMGIVH